MSKRTLAGDRRRRKMITVLWALGLSILIMILIYKELTAVLYILATVGVAVILMIVAFSDLSHSDGSADQLGQVSNSVGVAKK
jgi:preprotein translocase subunit SecD